MSGVIDHEVSIYCLQYAGKCGNILSIHYPIKLLVMVRP
jgi:hypothetical protein